MGIFTGLALGGLSAGLTALAGDPNKKRKKRAKKFAAQQELLAGRALEETEAARARRMASELTKTNVMGLLGAPGTYNVPGTPGAGPVSVVGKDVFTTTSDLAQPTGKGEEIFRYAKKKKKGALKDLKTTPRKGILDPQAAAEAIAGSSTFRALSRRTAEAEQLLARKGPEWDRLSNAVLGTIYEGAAEYRRQQIDQWRKAAAKRGGTARNEALREARRTQIEEEAMRMRVQETWTANLTLHNYIRQNATQVLQDTEFAATRVFPLINDNYNKAMAGITDIMVNKTLPMARAATAAGYAARDQVKDTNFVNKIITAGVSGAIGGLTGFGGGGIGGILDSTKQEYSALKRAGRDLLGLSRGGGTPTIAAPGGGRLAVDNPPGEF